MRKFSIMVILLGITAILLTGCGGKAADPASKAVEKYLDALVNKDSTKLSALSCASWEPNALLELDSLQAVKARLDGLACQTTGTSDTTSQVNCQGNILATYNGEDQVLDLSVRTYLVEKQGQEYLVCGYK